MRPQRPANDSQWRRVGYINRCLSCCYGLFGPCFAAFYLVLPRFDWFFCFVFFYRSFTVPTGFFFARIRALAVRRMMAESRWILATQRTNGGEEKKQNKNGRCRFRPADRVFLFGAIPVLGCSSRWCPIPPAPPTKKQQFALPRFSFSIHPVPPGSSGSHRVRLGRYRTLDRRFHGLPRF